ncbi:hypothetical protein CRG98_049770 [Punica granatum]|uniref:Uncharacterized protein n=1 Tax=Punica granatum TaxID=22663 RepID=A0A2I0H1Z7_PUNGR|nr:hypothetical protein CRG98_049770 [Punica granatum]
MMGAKFKVEKFGGSNDFGLWKIKMKALLVQHGLEGALKGEKEATRRLATGEKEGGDVERSKRHQVEPIHKTLTRDIV